MILKLKVVYKVFVRRLRSATLSLPSDSRLSIASRPYLTFTHGRFVWNEDPPGFLFSGVSPEGTARFLIEMDMLAALAKHYALPTPGEPHSGLFVTLQHQIHRAAQSARERAAFDGSTNVLEMSDFRLASHTRGRFKLRKSS